MQLFVEAVRKFSISETFRFLHQRILCPGLYKLSHILIFVVAETDVLYYWKPVTRAYADPSLEF
jgi:hypothetical protein